MFTAFSFCRQGHLAQPGNPAWCALHCGIDAPNLPRIHLDSPCGMKDWAGDGSRLWGLPGLPGTTKVDFLHGKLVWTLFPLFSMDALQLCPDDVYFSYFSGCLLGIISRFEHVSDMLGPDESTHCCIK